MSGASGGKHTIIIHPDALQSVYVDGLQWTPFSDGGGELVTVARVYGIFMVAVCHGMVSPIASRPYL